MRPAIVVATIAVVLAGGATWFKLRGAKDQNVVQYNTALAQVATVRKTVSASGTLQPWTTVDVKSKAGGRIDLLAVDLGSEVKQGQIIAKIDPTDSLLTYSQARADTQGAQAKEAQSGQTYVLQVQQSAIGVEQAQAQVDQARGNLRAAAARYQSARDASGVQPALTQAAIGQAKASYDSAVQDRARLDATQAQDRATTQAAYDQAVANDVNAQLSLTRQKALADKGYVALQTVDQAQASAGVTKAQVLSAKAKLDTLEREQQATRQAADAKVAQAQAQLNSAQTQSVDIRSKRNSQSEAQAAVLQAQAQLEQAEASLAEAKANRRNDQIRHLDIASAQAGTARAQASLSNAKTTLDQTTVRATSAGVVLKKYVEQGTIITSGLSLNSTGTSIVQIGDISRMYVDVAVDETDIASVDLGQRVDVSFDAYPGLAFEGKVSKIDPQAQVESNVTTVHVRVEVDNSAPSFRLLKPAMNATCDFVVGEAADVVAVPTEAVHTENEASYVQVAIGGKVAPADPTTGVAADPNAFVGLKIEKRSVEIGIEGNDTTEVKSGLREGERVVTGTVDNTPEETTTAKAAFGGGGPPGPPPGGGGGRR